jgi:hypothetical protein
MEHEEDDQKETQLGGCSEERWSSERDVHAFALILFEIQ